MRGKDMEKSGEYAADRHCLVLYRARSATLLFGRGGGTNI
jgi:hypothetical protein